MLQGGPSATGTVKKRDDCDMTESYILYVTWVPPGSRGTSAERVTLSHGDDEGKRWPREQQE